MTAFVVSISSSGRWWSAAHIEDM